MSSTGADIIKNEKCVKCSKIVYENTNSICCDKCAGWLHLACSGLKRKEFDKISDDTEFICTFCKNYSCGKCSAPVYPFQNAIQCSHDDCCAWYHLKCTHFTSSEYHSRNSRLHTQAWYCPECTHMPFNNINSNELTLFRLELCCFKETDFTYLDTYFDGWSTAFFRSLLPLSHRLPSFWGSLIRR